MGGRYRIFSHLWSPHLSFVGTYP